MILPNDARQDRAIRDEHGDKLERGPFVDSLVRALVRVNRDKEGQTVSAEATGYVVGLTGKWGLGKSSVLSLLALKLGSMDRVLVAQFNPWLLGTGEELLTGYFNALRAAIGRTNKEEFDALRDDLDKYWASIVVTAKVAAVAVDGGTSDAWWGKLIPKRIKSAARSPEQERANLEKKIKQLGCAVVVLIDELDRVEDDDVKAVARLVKAVGEIRGVSYLVAYDPKRVAEALGGGRSAKCREAGNSYLEKIIQHPIPLRPLFRDDVQSLLKAALEEHGVNLPDSPSYEETEILESILDAVQTPREVKRLVGSFAILEEAVRGEISPYDVMGYCWLATKNPTLRDLIADNIDRLVDDPSQVEMTRRVADKMSAPGSLDVTTVLGPLAVPHRKILNCLFPWYATRRTASAGNRLSKRRNLVRMLYLGNPPGMIPLKVIAAMWAVVASTQLVTLTSASTEGKLPEFLDRLDDLLAELPESGDAEFWPNLSRVLQREEDWLSGPNPQNELSRDAAEMLFRLGLRDMRQIPRVRRAVDALIQGGDLILAPWVVRNEMRIQGVSRNSRGEPGEGIYDKTTFAELLERELARYRSAILSGFALRRLPNAEVFYAILNCSRWDEELRAALTAQLNGAAAVGTFAGLITPPGYVTELDTLCEFCDADALNSEVSELLKDEASFPDPWIKESVLRLHRTLNGKDPLYGDDE